MPYTPTTWVTGDTVTPTKLNKIEQGLYDADNNSSSALVVTVTYDSSNYKWTMDKTAQTIWNACVAGTPVIVRETYPDNNVSLIYLATPYNSEYGNPYWFYTYYRNFSASSASEYPYSEGGE